MTREYFDKIKSSAVQMVAGGEIEWADFAHSDPEISQFGRNVFKQMMDDGDFAQLMRFELQDLFVACESQVESISENQEVDLQAVGLIQMALRNLMVKVFPKAREIEKTCPIRIKVKRIKEALIECPPDVYVPSLAQQKSLKWKPRDVQ